MVVYTYASEGKEFYLTPEGNAISRLKVKFTEGYPQYKKVYKRMVPTAWVTKGWVKERKEVN